MRRLALHFAFACCGLVTGCGESAPPDPAQVVVGRAENGLKFARQRCVICHKVGDRGANLGPAMPDAVKKAIDRSARLEEIVAELERTRPEHRETKRAKLDPLLAETDPERRLQLWLATYLADPKFENPANQMAVLPMTELERADLIAWLLSLR
ncbi:MAG: c-type cytochrome [Planctomycetes bacterium]|nr:c-type cytochrome [Planctomycetota bacterium]